MELSRFDKTLRFDGEIKFSVKELGKLYKNPKDITVLAIENLLRKNKVTDGVYLLVENNSNDRWIISKDETRRSKVKFHHHEMASSGKEILELCK